MTYRWITMCKWSVLMLNMCNERATNECWHNNEIIIHPELLVSFWRIVHSFRTERIPPDVELNVYY